MHHRGVVTNLKFKTNLKLNNVLLLLLLTNFVTQGQITNPVGNMILRYSIGCIYINICIGNENTRSNNILVLFYYFFSKNRNCKKRYYQSILSI